MHKFKERYAVVRLFPLNFLPFFAVSVESKYSALQAAMSPYTFQTSNEVPAFPWDSKCDFESFANNFAIILFLRFLKKIFLS